MSSCLARNTPKHARPKYCSCQQRILDHFGDIWVQRLESRYLVGCCGRLRNDLY